MRVTFCHPQRDPCRIDPVLARTADPRSAVPFGVDQNEPAGLEHFAKLPLHGTFGLASFKRQTSDAWEYVPPNIVAAIGQSERQEKLAATPRI